MNKMKTRKPGNIEVSEIGMGCMAFSLGYGAIPSREYAMEASNVTLTDEEFHSLEQALNSIKVYGHRGNVQFQGQSMKDWGKK